MIKWFKILLAFCLCIYSNCIFASSTDNSFDKYCRIQKIDLFDSIFINLHRAVYQGNYIEIPISIKSDDDINALDFEMKFDETKLKYVDLIVHFGGINANAFYNINDATLRVTSNSLVRYDKDTARLFSSRFEVLKGKILKSDFKDIMTYLNGFTCSYKIFNSVSSVSVKNPKLNPNFQVFPNPAKDFILIESSGRSKFQLLDIHGNILYTKAIEEENYSNRLNLSEFVSGLYFIRFFNEIGAYSRKFVIKK